MAIWGGSENYFGTSYPNYRLAEIFSDVKLGMKMSTQGKVLLAIISRSKSRVGLERVSRTLVIVGKDQIDGNPEMSLEGK